MKQATLEMYVRANTMMLTAIIATLITAGVMGANFYKKNKNTINKMLNADTFIENIQKKYH